MPERGGTQRSQGGFVLVLTASCQGEDVLLHLTHKQWLEKTSTMIASILPGVGKRVNMCSVQTGAKLTGTWVERRSLPVAG